MTNTSALVLRTRIPADRHPVATYLGTLGPGSRKTMRRHLDRIARFLTNGRSNAETLNWPSLKHQHIAAIRRHLQDNVSAATGNVSLFAVKGVLRQCWSLDYIDSETFLRMTDGKRGGPMARLRGEPVSRGRLLDWGGVSALFGVCERDRNRTAGLRDACVLGLMFGAAMRRQEVCDLDLADYDPRSGELVVCRGKGGKGRLLFATNGLQRALDDWIDVRGKHAGPLLHPLRKGGVIERARLTADGIYRICGIRGEQAGLPFRLRPHDGRRFALTTLIAANTDLSTTRAIAGHASIDTTLRYDVRPAQAKRKAMAETLVIPYKGEKT